jgi:multidrug efflux pump subunit AcrA (membrane-fusion protein)
MKTNLYNSILDHTDDGVLVLSRDGLILAANDNCGNLLSIPTDSLIGQSYSWIFFHETENQELSQLINDGLKKEIEYKSKEIHYKDPKSKSIRMLISTALLPAVEADADPAAAPVLLVFFKMPGGGRKSTSATDPLVAAGTSATDLVAQITELQQQNRILLASRTKRDVLYAFLAGVVFFLILLIIFSTQSRITIFPKTKVTEEQNVTRRIVTAKLDTLPRLIHAAGLLEPYYKLTLTAQAPGPIVKRNFNQGDFVEKGHILYQLDTKELAKSVRTARVAYIELLENYNQLKDWQGSLEVMQAKRSLELAKIAEGNEKKKLEETKKLYEKGIIPRVEFDQANTTYKKTGYDYENAKQQLESTLDKGSPERIEVLKLKLSNAKEELDEIEARFEASVVRAPVAGMVMAPEASDGHREPIKKEGDIFKEGDLIVTIGATESFIINTQVGELSARDVQVGQPVRVTGFSFPNMILQGKVDWIAASATVSEDESFYPLRISIPELPAEARRKVRFGMQAEAAICVSSLQGVITVPIDAISRLNGKDIVLMGENSALPEPRVVQAGYSDGSTIVIENGLRPGDKVLVSTWR